MATLEKFGTITQNVGGGLVLNGFEVDFKGEDPPEDMAATILELAYAETMRMFKASLPGE